VTSLEERRVCVRTWHKPECNVCHQHNTLEHILTSRPGSELIWMWKTKRLAQLLRLPQAFIPCPPPVALGSRLWRLVKATSKCGYMVIEPYNIAQVAQQTQTCTTSASCDAPAGKPSAGGNVSDYIVTKWTRCFEDIMRYHLHAWEPKRIVQSNIEETQPLNVPDRATFLEGGIRQSLHRSFDHEWLIRCGVYTIALGVRVSTTGVCNPPLIQQKVVILML
jgi:hypothetical protein